MIKRLWRWLFGEAHECLYNGGAEYPEPCTICGQRADVWAPCVCGSTEPPDDGERCRTCGCERVTLVTMKRFRQWVEHFKETDHDADVCGCEVYL